MGINIKEANELKQKLKKEAIEDQDKIDLTKVG